MVIVGDPASPAVSGSLTCSLGRRQGCFRQNPLSRQVIGRVAFRGLWALKPLGAPLEQGLLLLVDSLSLVVARSKCSHPTLP